MTGVDDSVATRLLRSSARHSYDPEVDLDWSAPEVEGLWWMQPERVSLYGTELWDSLTLEQQVELSRHEVGSQLREATLSQLCAAHELTEVRSM